MLARHSAIVLAIPAVQVTACYEYHPAEVAAVRPSEVVHVVLSPEAAVALRPAVGPNAAAMDGRVLSVDRDRVRLAVTQIVRSIGPEEFLEGEPLELPLAGTSAITVRRFDRARTVLAIGGVIMSAIAAAKVVDQPAIVATRGGTGTATR